MYNMYKLHDQVESVEVKGYSTSSRNSHSVFHEGVHSYNNPMSSLPVPTVHRLSTRPRATVHIVA